MPPAPATHPRAPGRALAGLGLAAALGLAYAAGWERTAFTLRRVEVPVLPAGWSPLRVLHLSDAHIRAGQHRKSEWIADLARLLPDVVVCTGDNLGGGPECVETMLRALDPLLDLPGVFVLGNNDYYGPKPKNPGKYFFPKHRRVQGQPLPWQQLVEGMAARGWQDLTNRSGEIAVGSRLIEFRGVDDPHLKRDYLSAVSGAGNPAALQLGVVHAPEPRVLDSFAHSGVALMFAGHTHGGQLRVPGFGALVTNCRIDRARCRGLSEYLEGDLLAAGPSAGAQHSWLHVSAGLGTSVYAPVRFACRPEATLLTLVPTLA